MPANDVYLANLRADGHRVRLYYGKFDGAVVLNASVSATPADQARDLAITVNSGSAASVRRGWLVRVETAGGLLKGITNVRAAGTISATNLPIHELGQSDIPIVSGDVVKIYNLPYLGDKIPTDDASFAPDNLTYVDQGTAVPPRVNSGGHFIGMVDSGQSYATVAMRGSLSSSEDPDSGGTITHLWTLLTGTLTFAPGSVSTDADPTLRASVGYGIAEHTVTDSSNSKAWTQYVCTQVYNDATPPYRLIDAELSADEATGWSGAMQTYAYSGLSDLYDGQFGGVFARETINGVTVSYGSDVPNRSHIKLLGFLSRDENDLDPQIRRIHLTLQSPWQRLASLPGFSKVFTREGEDWSTIAGLTVRLALLHLIRYYSFFMEFFDLRFDADFLNKLWSKYYLNKTTADNQIREIADGVDARVVSLRTGEMLVHTHPALIPLASRAAVTTTLTIAEQDCLSAPFTRDHWKVVETFELRGFVAGAADNATVFSRSPGLAPGRGAQSLAAERIISDGQLDANARCGRRAARADGVFLNSSNVYSRAVEWGVTLPGSYDVFDFNKEYIQTGLTGASNLRGVDLSAQNYYLSRMRITYTGGTARVNPTFLTATNAPAGATYVPSTEDSAPYTPPDFVPVPFVPPGNGGLSGRVQRIALICEFGVALTSDFQTLATAGGPTWRLPYAMPWTGTPMEWVPNGFAPGLGWIATDPDIRYLTLSSGANSVKYTHTPALGGNSGGADASFAQSGFYGRVYVDSTDGTVIIRSPDNVTFTKTVINSNTSNNWQPCALYVSSKTPGRMIAGVFTGLAVSIAYESLDYGATWSALSPAFVTSCDGFIHIHAPWAVPGDTTFFYASYLDALGNPGSARLYRYEANADVPNTQIAPVIGGNNFTVNATRSVLETSVHNANRLLAAVQFVTDHAVVLTNDAFAAAPTWTVVEAVGTNARHVALAGDDANIGWGFGENDYICQYAIDGNVVTIDIRTGNLASLSLGPILAIAGY